MHAETPTHSDMNKAKLCTPTLFEQNLRRKRLHGGPGLGWPEARHSLYPERRRGFEAMLSRAVAISGFEAVVA